MSNHITTKEELLAHLAPTHEAQHQDNESYGEMEEIDLVKLDPDMLYERGRRSTDPGIFDFLATSEAYKGVGYLTPIQAEYIYDTLVELTKRGEPNRYYIKVSHRLWRPKRKHRPEFVGQSKVVATVPITAVRATECICDDAEILEEWLIDYMLEHCETLRNRKDWAALANYYGEEDAYTAAVCLADGDEETVIWEVSLLPSMVAERKIEE